MLRWWELGVTQHSVREERWGPVGALVPASYSTPISCRKVKPHCVTQLVSLPMLGTFSFDLSCQYTRRQLGLAWRQWDRPSWLSQNHTQPADPGMLGGGVSVSCSGYQMAASSPGPWVVRPQSGGVRLSLFFRTGLAGSVSQPY